MKAAEVFFYSREYIGVWHMGSISNKDTIDINKIKPYEKNAKVHSAEQVEKIAKSIKEFGFLSPVLIDREGRLPCRFRRAEFQTGI